MEVYFPFISSLLKVRRIHRVGEVLIPVSLFCLGLLIPIMHSGLYFPLVVFMGHPVTFRNLDWVFIFFSSRLIFPNDRRAKRHSMQCCCRITCEKNLKKVPFLARELI